MFIYQRRFNLGCIWRFPSKRVCYSETRNSINTCYSKLHLVAQFICTYLETVCFVTSALSIWKCMHQKFFFTKQHFERIFISIFKCTLKWVFKLSISKLNHPFQFQMRVYSFCFKTRASSLCSKMYVKMEISQTHFDLLK